MSKIYAYQIERPEEADELFVKLKEMFPDFSIGIEKLNADWVWIGSLRFVYVWFSNPPYSDEDFDINNDYNMGICCEKSYIHKNSTLIKNKENFIDILKKTKEGKVMTKQQLFEILKGVYCEVDQFGAKYLHGLCVKICPELEYIATDMMVNSRCYFFTALSAQDCPYVTYAEKTMDKIRISYEEMSNRLKAFGEEGYNDIVFTDKELFLIRTVIGSIPLGKAMDSIEKTNTEPYHNTLKTLRDQKLNNIYHSLFIKLNDLCNDKGLTDKIFEPKVIKKFKFKCGLTATQTEAGMVKIGCKEFSKDDILAKLVPLFDLLDEITIDGYLFGKEFLRFAEELEKW